MPILDRQNLYDGEEYFLLRIGNLEYAINEPVNWDKTVSELSRDADFYGFNYEFISGKAELQFTYRDGGGDILKSIFKANGGDGQAQLEFGAQYSSQRFPQFIGDINLNDYVDNLDAISATVEKVNFEALIRTRYETKVSLNAAKDYEGNLIASPTPMQLALHSKSIVKIASYKSEEAQYDSINNTDVPSPPLVKIHYFQPDTQSSIAEELDGMQKMPFAILSETPVNNSLFQYEAVEDGELEVTILVEGLFTFQGSGSVTPTGSVGRYYLYLERSLSTGYEVAKELSAVAHGNVAVYDPQPATFSIPVQKTDRIYVGSIFELSTTINGIYHDQYRNTITFKQKTVASPSVCSAYKVFDLLSFLMQVVTGKAGRVISSFYGAGGEGEKNAITSGYALRNFDVNDDKPVQAALKTMLDSLQVVHNIGIGFKQVNGLDYMVVEPMLHFFNRNVITRIDNAYDWQEVQDKSSLFNEVEIGFSKFAQDEFNTLDDANTLQNWLLPIKKYKAKLSRKSDLITSGYLLEIQRREQYAKKPSTSLDSDDDLFLVAYTDDVRYPQIGFEFFAADKSITFEKPVGLIIGDRFSIDGAANNSTYQVNAIKYDKVNSYLIDTVFDEAGVGTMIVEGTNLTDLYGPDLKFAERNQYFSVLENVIDAGSVYNLRYTAKRCLFAQAPLLNIGLDKKLDTDLIINTFSKNNGDLRSALSASAPFSNFEGSQTFSEKEDIALSSFARDSAPYSSEQVVFKAQVPYSQIDLIKQALKGETNTSVDNGSIIVKDADSIDWLMCVRSIKYDFGTNVAEFTVNKITSLYVEP